MESRKSKVKGKIQYIQRNEVAVMSPSGGGEIDQTLNSQVLGGGQKNRKSKIYSEYTNCKVKKIQMNFEAHRDFAVKLDKEDPLRSFREKFIIPHHNGKDQVYFLGNSLGLQPKTARSNIDKVLGQWSDYGVEAFFLGDDPWMNYHDHLLKPLGKITGALPSEITVMNQLTVNLHLMMVSFYRPDGKRNKIICEAKAFPSDQYMFETHVRHHGLDPDTTIIEVKPREGEQSIRMKSY
jgi:kynureninase